MSCYDENFLSLLQPRFITVAELSIDQGNDLREDDEMDDEPYDVEKESRDQQNTVIRHRLTQSMDSLKDSMKWNKSQQSFMYSTIGNACKHNGDYDEAICFYREAINAKRKEITGEQQQQQQHNMRKKTDIADLYISMALVLKEKFMLDESLEAFEEALRLYEDTDCVLKRSNDDERHVLLLKTVNTLNHIGNIRFEKRELDTAMQKYIKALLITKSSIPENSNNSSSSLTKKYLHVADTLNNLASVHAEKAERKEALKAYNIALAMQTDALGEDAAAVANTLSNIGTINFKDGLYDMALKSYKQVLKMRRTIFFGETNSSENGTTTFSSSSSSEHDLRVADALNNIAIVYSRTKQPQRAKEIFTEALRVARKTLGVNHPKVAEIYGNIGFLAASRMDIHKKNGAGDNTNTDDDKKREDEMTTMVEEALYHLNKARTIYKAIGVTDDRDPVFTITRSISIISYKNRGRNDACVVGGGAGGLGATGSGTVDEYSRVVPLANAFSEVFKFLGRGAGAGASAGGSSTNNTRLCIEQVAQNDKQLVPKIQYAEV